MAKNTSDSDTIIIKKYANRRLYNTGSSSYITLDYLAQMIRDKQDFKVVDAKSGEDITRSVLTQIIMDQEGTGQNMLPVSFLRDLIAMYGNSMSAMMPQYLEASMQAFQRNHAKFRETMEGAIGAGPFGDIARRNMEMFEAATGAFRGGKKIDDDQVVPVSSRDDEVAALKSQLAEMQDKIDRLSD